ncbi:hypothetical protein ABB22_10990 [Stenotrophomonas nitritireducens]|uniref:Uncharacterized protein n=1 Tax=Stenotrophomonas nitritireducens TaxID=83617 RepID=A0ABR5NJD7_9GAMM|nr:hypothetical protein ABB22_10990 [Stenotrophomonas nitritireducens]
MCAMSPAACRARAATMWHSNCARCWTRNWPRAPGPPGVRRTRPWPWRCCANSGARPRLRSATTTGRH